MTDQEFVRFLQDVLPGMGLKWAGFRNVRGTVRRRIARRLRELGLADLDAYRDYLERTPEEWPRFHAMCRIPISRFYRDRAVFRLLGEDVLPSCAAAALKAGRGDIRCLCIGCASGEEPYSVNLVWLTSVAQQHAGLGLDILALDADETMLGRARAGHYKASSLKEVPKEIRQTAFEQTNGEFRLRTAFRTGIRFNLCDVREAMPSGPFDIVMCRNLVFTYFSDAVQRELFEQIDGRLTPGGFLIVGGHEHLPCDGRRYRPLRLHVPIYQKAEDPDADAPARAD
ncbi:MAG: CheR family methyltransferase [Hyphomicrobiales bacterium]